MVRKEEFSLFFPKEQKNKFDFVRFREFRLKAEMTRNERVNRRTRFTKKRFSSKRFEKNWRNRNSSRIIRWIRSRNVRSLVENWKQTKHLDLFFSRSVDSEAERLSGWKRRRRLWVEKKRIELDLFSRWKFLSASFIDIIHRANLEPEKKYRQPQTTNQEIGWFHDPLVKKENRIGSKEKMCFFLRSSWKLIEPIVD